MDFLGTAKIPKQWQQKSVEFISAKLSNTIGASGWCFGISFSLEGGWEKDQIFQHMKDVISISCLVANDAFSTFSEWAETGLFFREQQNQQHGEPNLGECNCNFAETMLTISWLFMLQS